MITINHNNLSDFVKNQGQAVICDSESIDYIVRRLLNADAIPLFRRLNPSVGGTNACKWLRTALGNANNQGAVTYSDIVQYCRTRWLTQTKNLMAIRKMNKPQNTMFRTLCILFSIPSELYKDHLERNNLLRKEDN